MPQCDDLSCQGPFFLRVPTGIALLAKNHMAAMCSVKCTMYVCMYVACVVKLIPFTPNPAAI